MDLICFLRQGDAEPKFLFWVPDTPTKQWETVSFFVLYAEKLFQTPFKHVQKPNAAQCTKQILLQSIICGVYRENPDFRFSGLAQHKI